MAPKSRDVEAVHPLPSTKKAALKVRQGWAVHEEGRELSAGKLDEDQHKLIKTVDGFEPFVQIASIILLLLAFLEPPAHCDQWGCPHGRKDMPHGRVFLRFGMVIIIQAAALVPIAVHACLDWAAALCEDTEKADDEFLRRRGQTPVANSPQPQRGSPLPSEERRTRHYQKVPPLVQAKLVFCLLVIIHSIAAALSTHGPSEWVPRIGLILRDILAIMCLPVARRAAVTVVRVLPVVISTAAMLAVFALLSGIVITTTLHDNIAEDTSTPFHGYLKASYHALTSMTNLTPNLYASLAKDDLAWMLLFAPLLFVGSKWIMPLTTGMMFSFYEDAKRNVQTHHKKVRDRYFNEAYKLLEESNTTGVSISGVENLIGALEELPSVSKADSDFTQHLLTTADTAGSQRWDKSEFRELMLQLYYLYKSQRSWGSEPKEVEDWDGYVRMDKGTTVEQAWFRPWFGWYGSTAFSAQTLDITVLSLLGFNLLLLVLELAMWGHPGEASTAEILFNLLEEIMVIVYVAEAIIKMAKYSPHRYFHTPQHAYDAVLTLTMFVSTMITWAPNGIAVDYIMKACQVARILRLAKLLKLIHKKVRRTIEGMLSAIDPTVGLIAAAFAFFSIFAQIGVMMYGGVVYYSNSKIKDSAFFSHNYEYLNFNDFKGAMLLVYSMFVQGSGWQYLAEGFSKAVSSGAVAYLFFGYFAGTLVVANLLISIFCDRLQEFVLGDREEVNEDRKVDPDLSRTANENLQEVLEMMETKMTNEIESTEGSGGRRGEYRPLRK